MEIGFIDFSQGERNRILSTLRLLGDQTALDELDVYKRQRPLGLPVQADGIAWWYEGDSLIPVSYTHLILSLVWTMFAE